ncbi:MAG: XcyI family restriction endonuclease [Acidimicrobiales bacterium]
MAEFALPPPARQVYIRSFLANARTSVLSDAIRDAVRLVDPATLAAEMDQHAPPAARQILQGLGVRDDTVFAVPSVLRQDPRTLGYYRLLLGVSQKRFYGRGSGMGPFKAMEDRGGIRADLDRAIPELCKAMNQAMGELVTTVGAALTPLDVEQLPLMTLGAQADGSWRTRIGQRATEDVFDALKSVVKAQGIAYVDGAHALSLTNAAQRHVTIALAADPDVVIKETVNTQEFFKVAIEIKGGTDHSNAHNRAGEAEKSHRKAADDGASDFWTVMSTTGVSMSTLRTESPTTKQWFDLEEVLAGAGPGWDRLVNHVRIVMGI